MKTSVDVTRDELALALDELTGVYEGEVLAYSGDFVLLLEGEKSEWLPVPREARHLFDTIPARDDDSNLPGATARLTFTRVGLGIRLTSLDARGNAPGAAWRVLR